MASAWGLSWGNSWGNSWGLLQPEEQSKSGVNRLTATFLQEQFNEEERAKKLSESIKTQVTEILEKAAVPKPKKIKKLEVVAEKPKPQPKIDVPKHETLDQYAERQTAILIGKLLTFQSWRYDFGIFIDTATSSIEEKLADEEEAIALLLL